MSRVPLLRASEWRAGDDASRAAFARSLRQGLETTGFVLLEEHGIAPSALEAAYRAVERFFALAPEQKRRSGGVAGGQRGYTGFAVEHARDHGVPDLKEFFHVGQDVPGRGECSYPANRWPAEVPALRPALVRLFQELERCAGELLDTLALAYELPGSVFSGLIVRGNSILRALHYPPVPPDAPAGALRAAPHEDINLVTLLCGATEQGLEIRSADGEWLPVESKPGQIVADSGDMLSRLTGGVIPATTHRVVNPVGASANRSRYALPFFAHPRPECDLSVLERFATPERVADHPPITAGAYLAERLREIGLAPSP